MMSCCIAMNQVGVNEAICAHILGSNTLGSTSSIMTSNLYSRCFSPNQCFMIEESNKSNNNQIISLPQTHKYFAPLPTRYFSPYIALYYYLTSMTENISQSKLGAVKSGSKPQRQTSQSRNSSSQKLLKRKPDGSKGMGSCKKKRESMVSEYFLVLTEPQEVRTVSDHCIFPRYIADNKENKIEHNRMEERLNLETARSEDNLFFKKEKPYKLTQAQDQLSRESCHSSLSHSNNQLFPNQSINQEHLIINSKKSKTQFFTFNQLSPPHSHQNVNEVTCLRQSDFSLSYQDLKKELQSLAIRNKFLEEQLQQVRERQYLLQTQLKQLYQILKEKQESINQYQMGKQNKQAQKYSSQISRLKYLVEQEERRNCNLKEESHYIQNELISKNQELILIYNQYTDLQVRSRKQQQRMKIRFEKMKAEVQSFKKQTKQEPFLDYGHFNQSQKWREQILKQQQEIKYLKIQNQCLLISKEELGKSENECRKLRDERDYFKMKVMQSIKRSKGQGDSILFQLSDLSVSK